MCLVKFLAPAVGKDLHPGRLTCECSFLSFTHVDEGADGLWGGVAQDCVQHRLAELDNHTLALILVG